MSACTVDSDEPVEPGSNSGFKQSEYNSLNPTVAIQEGGYLYDQWFANANAPLKKHPSIEYVNFFTNADTWRCSFCHGWKYSGDNRYDTPGLFSTKQLRTPNQIFNSIKLGIFSTGSDSNHNFSPQGLNSPIGMENSQIYALTYFIKNAIKPIDAGLTGDATRGETIYLGNCRNCHGTGGTGVDGSGDGTVSGVNLDVITSEQTDIFFGIGRFIHVLRYGTAVVLPANAGISMSDLSSYIDLGQNEDQAIMDLLIYIQDSPAFLEPNP